MADRTPIFEMHILPMLRLLDRQHMLRVNPDLDLWSYDSVKASAAAIIARSCSATPTMPTAGVGGAWPSEWRALFKRWVDGGCRRLSLGTAQNLKLVQGAGRYTLSCTAAIPDQPVGDSTAWFDVVDAGPQSATYRLYVFAGEAVPPPAEQFDLDVSERVDAAAAPNGVVVIDATGSHRVTL